MTTEERDVMLKALRQSESLFSRYYLNENFNDVQFDFVLKDDIVIGAPFSVILLVKNKSYDIDYPVNVNLRIDCVNYMGKIGDAVKEETYDLLVRAESGTYFGLFKCSSPGKYCSSLKLFVRGIHH